MGVGIFPSNSTERKSKNPAGFEFSLACNCFCEHGTMLPHMIALRWPCDSQPLVLRYASFCAAVLARTVTVWAFNCLGATAESVLRLRIHVGPKPFTARISLKVSKRNIAVAYPSAIAVTSASGEFQSRLKISILTLEGH